MKLINSEQNLMAISGGSLGYGLTTNGGALLGSMLGGLLGFVGSSVTGKHPSGLCSALIFTALGGTVGTIGGLHHRK